MSLFRPVPGAMPPDPSQPPPLAAPFLPLVASLAGTLASGEPSDGLRADLEAFDHALGALREQFRNALCFQDLTPDEEQIAAEVMEAFSEVAERLEPLQQAVEQGDVDAMSAETPPLVAHLRALSAALARLQAAETERPALSPVPAVDAILRVAKAVREERLAFDVLEGRLLAVLTFVDGVAASLQGASGEAAALQTLVAAHREALERLRQCAENELVEAIATAAEAVRETAQALYDAQQQQPLAQSVEAMTAGEPASLEGLPAYAQQIVTLADRLLEGDPCLETFAAAVQDLRQRAQQALALLEKMPVLGPDVPDDERLACEEGQAVMMNGLERLFEALEHFDAVCTGGDGWSLDPGVERLRAAIAEMRALPQAFERLRR